MTEYRSNRGRKVDIDSIIAQNETAVAVGNAKMNARGDLIGPGGKVVKTREQMNQEYYKDNPNAVKQVDVRADAVNQKEQELAPVKKEEIQKTPKKTRSKKSEVIEPVEPTYPVDETKSTTDEFEIGGDDDSTA